MEDGDVGVRCSMVCSRNKTNIELNSERMVRKNSIVAYTIPENESNSKSIDKESVLKL